MEFHDCFDSSCENSVNNEKNPPQNKIEETVSKLVGEIYLPVPTSSTACPSKSLSLLRAISRDSLEVEEVTVRRMSDRVKFLGDQDDRSNGSRDELSRDDHLNEDGQYFSDNQMKVFETIFQVYSRFK